MGYGGGYGQSYGMGYGGGVDNAIAHPEQLNLPGIVNGAITTQDDLAKLRMTQAAMEEQQTLAPLRLKAAQDQAQQQSNTAQQSQQQYNEWQMADAFKDFDPNAPNAAQDYKARIDKLTDGGNPLAAQWGTYAGELGFRRMMGAYGQEKTSPLEGYAASTAGGQVSAAPNPLMDEDYVAAQARSNSAWLQTHVQTGEKYLSALNSVLSYTGDNWRDEWSRQAAAMGMPNAAPPSSLSDVERLASQVKGEMEVLQKVGTAQQIGGLGPQKESVQDVGGAGYAVSRDPTTGKVTMKPLTQDMDSIGTLEDGREVFMDKHSGEYSISPFQVGPKPGTTTMDKPMSPSEAMVQAQKIVASQENARAAMGDEVPKDYNHDAAVDKMFNAIVSANSAGPTASGAPAPVTDKHAAAATLYAQAQAAAKQAAAITDPTQRRAKLNQVRQIWLQNWKQKGFEGTPPPLPGF